MKTNKNIDTSRKMNYRQLKLLAIICMIFDHATCIFPIDRMLFPLSDWLWASRMEALSDGLLTWVPYFLSFIGRLGAPIFLFCIVNGFFHTRNVKKYIERIAFTAILAQAPYLLFEMAQQRLYGAEFSWYLAWQMVHLNILFTLAIGLTALALFESLKKQNHLPLGIMTAIAAGALCHFLPTEGKEGYILILFCFYFMVQQKASVQAAIMVPVVAISRVRLILLTLQASHTSMVLSCILNVAGNYFGTLIPIFFYSGEKGCVSPWLHRFMYAFYPLHLLLLAAIGFLRPPF